MNTAVLADEQVSVNGPAGVRKMDGKPVAIKAATWTSNRITFVRS